MNLLGAQVKIIDFGFATVLAGNSLAFSTLGSPINMDPGILKKFVGRDDKGYDEKVDIWSLGTLCYEMLIGKPTFEAKTMRELQEKIDKGEYTLPTSLSKEAVSFLNAMLQYDSSYRLTAEELSRHHFLTRDIKQFTRINMNEVKNNLTEDDKLKINVKKNQSIWAIFNNNDLDDVSGYIIENNEKDKFLAPIAEMENVNLNDNGNINNNMNNNININNNNNMYNNQNNYQMNNRNVNYYYPRFNNQRTNYNPYGFRNNLVNKNMNFQQNSNNFSKSNGKQSTQSAQIQKKDIKEVLMGAFNSMLEDCLILDPIFIPIIAGEDPADKFNEEEQL
jgi:serine/threonine protein kinase